MEEVMMQFLESEVKYWRTNDNTGEMQMSIPLSTILSKLPKNRKIKICRFISKEAVETEFFPRLADVRFQNFVAMNFEQTQGGSRTLTSYANLLENLCCLAETYGKQYLNEVLSKCDVSRKCTIEYVKAILKNNRSGVKPRIDSEKIYLEKIDKVVTRLM